PNLQVWLIARPEAFPSTIPSPSHTTISQPLCPSPFIALRAVTEMLQHPQSGLVTIASEWVCGGNSAACQFRGGTEMPRAIRTSAWVAAVVAAAFVAAPVWSQEKPGKRVVFEPDGIGCGMPPVAEGKPIDLVICLDISGSMDGLIDS